MNGNFVGRKEYENGIIEGLFAFDRDDPAGMLLNGFGRAFSAQGFYEGMLQSGIPHGPGRAIYSNGDIKEGMWDNGSFKD